MSPELQAALLGAVAGVIAALVGLIPNMQNYIKKRIEIATTQIQQNAANEQNKFKVELDQTATIASGLRVSNENVSNLIVQLGRMVDGLGGMSQKADSTETAIDRLDDTLGILLKVGSTPVQRIDSNVAVAIREIEEVRDIGVAAADQGNDNFELILIALDRTQKTVIQAINNAVKEVRQAIEEKRKTGTQPIVPIETEIANVPIKEK